ncbi:hypothetical protein TNCV_4880811 [Trichonephila clavipes]|nr:hypothetical protein TNCV_4880811 [Trichonephila clavipes]
MLSSSPITHVRGFPSLSRACLVGFKSGKNAGHSIKKSEEPQSSIQRNTCDLLVTVGRPLHRTINYDEYCKQRCTQKPESQLELSSKFFKGSSDGNSHRRVSLPVPTDEVVSQVSIKSSTLEQVVAIHSGMATERAGLVSSQAKPVEVYSQTVVRWLGKSGQ